MLPPVGAFCCRFSFISAKFNMRKQTLNRQQLYLFGTPGTIFSTCIASKKRNLKALAWKLGEGPQGFHLNIPKEAVVGALA